MNEETLRQATKEELIDMLDNQMDYTEQLEERIARAINYIDQVIGYKPCAKEIDKELNTLVGILREIK